MAAVASAPQGDANSRLALAIQHETRVAVQGIKSRGIMSRKEWANPLAAAPSAVGTMAILLKTASSSIAAGIPVENRVVKDIKGNQIGTLDSALLRSNLEACGELGRSAFATARTTMDYINQISNKMTEDQGKLKKILLVLNNPANAGSDLGEELDDIREDTDECLVKLDDVTEVFHYWYRVICCLKENVIEGQGHTQKKANDTHEEQNEAKIAADKHSSETDNLEKTIEALEAQLASAVKNVEMAEATTKELASLPPIPEPSLEEEIARVEKEIPMEKRNIGLKGWISKKIQGESSEEFAARMDYIRNVELRRNERIDRAKKQRDDQRKDAERKLTEAKKAEERLRNQHRKNLADLKKNRDGLATAKANLEKTKNQFKRLADEKIELADIVEILHQSAEQLGELKQQVQALELFFKSILNDVSITVKKDVKREFLRPIDRGIRKNRAGMVTDIAIDEEGRNSVRESAYRIQASFCAIRDITRVYVDVSDRYISKAIDKMMELSSLTDAAWKIRSVEFTDWCKTSMTEIEDMTDAVARRLEESVTERVSSLVRHAIEPVH